MPTKPIGPPTDTAAPVASDPLKNATRCARSTSTPARAAASAPRLSRFSGRASQANAANADDDERQRRDERRVACDVEVAHQPAHRAKRLGEIAEVLHEQNQRREKRVQRHARQQQHRRRQPALPRVRQRIHDAAPRAARRRGSPRRRRRTASRAPKVIAIIAPSDAPAATPSVNGVASGLRSSPERRRRPLPACAPTSAAASARGSRAMRKICASTLSANGTDAREDARPSESGVDPTNGAATIASDRGLARAAPRRPGRRGGGPECDVTGRAERRRRRRVDVVQLADERRREHCRRPALRQHPAAATAARPRGTSPPRSAGRASSARSSCPRPCSRVSTPRSRSGSADPATPSARRGRGSAARRRGRPSPRRRDRAGRRAARAPTRLPRAASRRRSASGTARSASGSACRSPRAPPRQRARSSGPSISNAPKCAYRPISTISSHRVVEREIRLLRHDRQPPRQIAARQPADVDAVERDAPGLRRRARPPAAAAASSCRTRSGRGCRRTRRAGCRATRRRSSARDRRGHPCAGARSRTSGQRPAATRSPIIADRPSAGIPESLLVRPSNRFVTRRRNRARARGVNEPPRLHEA